MFDVGFAEIFLLSVIGLLVLGPERLPAVARTLGGLIRKARASWYQLRRTIESELDAAEVSKTIQSAKKDFQNVKQQVSDAATDPIAAIAGENKPVEEDESTESEKQVNPEP